MKIFVSFNRNPLKYETMASTLRIIEQEKNKLEQIFTASRSLIILQASSLLLEISPAACRRANKTKDLLCFICTRLDVNEAEN